MSKIICDICGTSYADTAVQCPICGCVRPAQTNTVPDEDTPNGGYTYVKGGRFSKSNVKKRNNASKKPEKQEKQGGKKGTAILLIVLILIGVVAIGVILWAAGVLDPLFGSEGTPSTTPAPTPAAPTQPLEIPCEGLIISDEQIVLTKIGDTFAIDYMADPINTTDVIHFSSEDETIATVDENGVITAVQAGTTNIVIVCGNVETTREVVVGDPNVKLELLETSFVLKEVGETRLIYAGPIPVEDISWETSNEYMATVSNGVVTAVASGPVTITATYMDQVVTCDVLCDIDYSGSSGGITEDGGISEDGGSAGTNIELVTWNQLGPLYYKNDTTLRVGETNTLYLGNSDGSGERITPTWTCKENEYISVSGNVVKALKSTNMQPIKVTAEFHGMTYTCLVRVS